MDSDELDFRLRQLTRIHRILEELSSIDEDDAEDLRAYSEAIEDAFLAIRGASDALRAVPPDNNAAHDPGRKGK
ncbi:MAG TPA: hypothetical protein VN035_14940 [Microbacterium sp.]|nr:hypothetical protein [Microbacterium sp.]